MAKRDYYEVLGVDRGAGKDEIKKAYRRLAQKHHPDRNPDNPAAAESFKEAGEAHEALSDPEKRRMYDSHGHAAFEGGFGGGGGPNVDFGHTFNDIFENIFGGGRGGARQRGPRRGDDHQQQIAITLEQAAAGKTLKTTLPTQVRCDDCNGHGTANGKPPNSCQQCKGRGEVQYARGIFTVAETCPLCRGAGTLVTEPCKTCKGNTFTEKMSELEITIPAGVQTGNQLRVPGKGGAGAPGGEAGDLYIKIHVSDHPIFERDGENLHCKVPISFADAVLGCDCIIPTLDGKAELPIPAGTQAGQIFRLKGKGMPVLNRRRGGDLFCHVDVEVPVNLNAEQRKIIEDLRDSMADTEDDEQTPKETKWADKMKSFWDNLKT